MSEWISVEDRLPDGLDLVLTWDGDEVWVGNHTKEYGWISGTNSEYPEDIHVTHWMPFPASPVR